MSIRPTCLLLAATVMASVTIRAQDPTPLATARQQALGTKVTKIAGRVTAGASLFRNTAFLQDASAGIAVFNRTFREGVRVGDSVIIENANLTEFGQTSGQPGTGLTQLTGDSIRFTVVPGERREPQPRTVAIPRVSGPSGEEYEGQLVRLRNVRFVQQGLFQGETTYQIIDAFGNDVDVRLDGGTEIAINNLSIPTGDIDLIGLVSQFRGSYQIQPRFATDLGLPPLEKDTVARGNTLDVTTWNLEWLGTADTSRGPSDKDRQFRSIRQVMDSIRADMYGVQEVLTAEALSRVADSLAGSYSSVFAAEVPSDQKMGWIYNRDIVTPVSTGLAVCGAGDAWAGGRFPFRMTFDTKVGSETVRMVAFVIHAKASTDTVNPKNDYDRRKNDGEVFYNYLTEFYKDSNLIIIGDFNDDMTTSVIDSTLVTPWTAFTEDKTNYSVLTLPLSERGLVSYVGFNRAFLDHIIVSNEVVPLIHRTYIEAPQAYMSSYSSTVSDHLPVTVRIRTNGASTSVDEDVEAVLPAMRIAPNPMTAGGIVELRVASATHLRVDIVDVMGRTVQTLTDEYAAASTRILPIDATGLAAGSYLLRVARDGAVTTSTFVVNR